MDKEYLEQLVGPEAAADIWERHRAALRSQQVGYALSLAVAAAGGRNEKAIRALLDEEAIAASEDSVEAARQAVAQLKQEQGWLFVPPAVSSPGTGALVLDRQPSMGDIAAMTMAEYRQYRNRK